MPAPRGARRGSRRPRRASAASPRGRSPPGARAGWGPPREGSRPAPRRRGRRPRRARARGGRRGSQASPPPARAGAARAPRSRRRARPPPPARAACPRAPAPRGPGRRARPPGALARGGARRGGGDGRGRRRGCGGTGGGRWGLSRQWKAWRRATPSGSARGASTRQAAPVAPVAPHSLDFASCSPRLRGECRALCRPRLARPLCPLRYAPPRDRGDGRGRGGVEPCGC